MEEDIAGIRRRRSDEAAVSRVGEALNRTLEAERDEEATPRDHFSPVQVRFPVNAAALRPPIEEVVEGHVVGGGDNPKVDAGDDGNNGNVSGSDDGNMPDIVDFDAENGVDGDKAQEHARHVKIEFDKNDVRFWFSQ